MKTRLLFACAPSLLAFFAMSCSSPDFCVGAACGTVDGGDDDGGGGGDGGKDAAGDATVHDGGADADAMGQGDTSPPGCNTSADIAPQSACVTDGNGIFVNGMTGSDLTGSGTKESAFKSIGKAIGVSSSGGRVFICATTYQEPVKLTSNVSLYGGFDCTGWAYSTSNVPKVSPTAAGYALDLESVSGVTIEDLEFDSVAGVNPGDSSVAVFAATSTNIEFRNDRITAASAGSTPSKPVTSPNYTGANAPKGKTASDNNGLTELPCSCMTFGGSTGGGSGSGGQFGGAPGGPGGVAFAGSGPGAGGVYAGSACGNGGTGASGDAGTGSSGATLLGVLSATGSSPTPGSVGTGGQAGQGGGGGSGGKITAGDTDGAGGGGGCGGCGGSPGAPGAGGGSSFAVLSFNSTLTFDSCNLTASSGSNGGAGGDGDPGQSGGFGGTQSAPGCQGGVGGNGGNGGGGGGGAAGVSVDVGFIGMPPTVMANCTTSFSSQTASGGPAGVNGMPDAGMGRAGTNAATLDLSK